MEGKDIQKINKLIKGKLGMNEVIAIVVTVGIASMIAYNSYLNIKLNRYRLKEFEK